MDKRTNKLIHALGSYHVTFARLVSAMMAALLLVTTMPALPAYASPSLVVPEGAGPPHLGLSPAHEHIRGGPHKIEKIVPRLSFSEHPSDLEISNARVLPEALVAMTGPGVSGENDALAKALVATKQKGDPENLSDLTAFIKEFPHSRWVPSLQLNLALIRFETGYLSDSMKLLRSSWEGAKNEKGLAQRAVADRAVAKLMLMCTRLGLVSDLKNLFAETDGRGFYGSDEEMVRDSKHGYWVMEHKPETAFRCGPCAIDSILSQMKKSSARSEITKNAKSTCNGTNLAQVKGWASQAGLNLQMAKRSPGAPVPVPAIMHWAVGHFAAIVEKRDGHYILKDSTFDTDLTLALSDAGLEQATDGYFLVPAGQLPKGWRTVSDEEAQTVWGKGGIGGYDPNAKYPPAPEICLLGGGSGGGVGGMARASCWTMSGSLNIVDVPLSYKPPLGPSMDFRINYSEGESNQPATFTFTNLGPDWTFGWLSYLSVNAMSSVATVRLRTGGSEVYTPSGGVYTNDILTQALLVNEGGGVYQRQLPDGSVEVYSQPDGSGNIFLTEVIDPQGNSALIQYDAHMRITSITVNAPEKPSCSALSERR